MQLLWRCATLFLLFLLLLASCEGNGLSYRERSAREDEAQTNRGAIQSGAFTANSPLTLVALSNDGVYLTVTWEVQGEIDYLLLSLVKDSSGDSSGDSGGDEQLVQYLLPALYRQHQMALPQDYVPSQLKIRLEAYPANGGSPLLVTRLLSSVEPSSDLLLPEDYLQSLEEPLKGVASEATADAAR